MAAWSVAHIDAANTARALPLADGATFSVVEDELKTSRHRRVLQEAAEPSIQHERARLLLGEAEMKAHRRRLGFFSALMTSGSFMCMQAGAFCTQTMCDKRECEQWLEIF